MTQKLFDIALGNIAVRDFGRVEDEDNSLVTCTLTVDGRDYECAEYIDSDGDIFRGADCHLHVNGIRDVATGTMESFVCRGMDRHGHETWASAHALVVTAMQAFLEDKVPDVRWHLNWAAENAIIIGGDYDSLDDAERAARTWEAELRDMCCEDWLLDKHLAGEMRIFPLVDGDEVGETVTIPVRDLIDAEPSLAA